MRLERREKSKSDGSAFRGATISFAKRTVLGFRSERDIRSLFDVLCTANLREKTCRRQPLEHVAKLVAPRGTSPAGERREAGRGTHAGETESADLV